ncbi:unnamed protein product [Thlaspi arvense]|uniref:RING-type E3 ubiquitin transferase n=1 Tax=Thlaspi arvense TaxID=13288 RepID=A0AAU9TAB4_THLAR|nr:unnamed protein product [Thlaspi arvense]
MRRWFDCEGVEICFECVHFSNYTHLTSSMVGASTTNEGTGSNSILLQKRKRSWRSPGDGAKRENQSLMLLDPDVLDCPICFEAFKIPIFQCDNGHLACSSCCPKLSGKCPACSFPIGNNRCRAMESVLESVLVPCPNAKFGCNKNVSYGKVSTHEQEFAFSQCSCPAQDCNFTGLYNHLYDHYNDVPHCFREPYGVYVTVSCIAPSAPEVGEFSYHLSYTVDGHTITYGSPEVKRIREVSYQTPQENFMLIPNSFLCGELLEMKVCIKKSNQE